MDAGAFVNVLGDIGLAPVGGVQVLAQLRRDDNDIITGPNRIMPHVGAHLGGEGFQNFLGPGRPLVHELTGRTSGKDRYRGYLRRQSALDRQRLPGGVFFVLGDAIAEFSRMPKGRSVDPAGSDLEDVDQREADGSADDGRGAVAVPERG